MEGVPISDLCDEEGLQPTVFYRWQKEFFENGAAAFQQRGRTDHQPEQERIAYLERKIQTKDEVLAELMAEHVALKPAFVPEGLFLVRPSLGDQSALSTLATFNARCMVEKSSPLRIEFPPPRICQNHRGFNLPLCNGPITP